jgi:hypothetical protein
MASTLARLGGPSLRIGDARVIHQDIELVKVRFNARRRR